MLNFRDPMTGMLGGHARQNGKKNPAAYDRPLFVIEHEDSTI